ncbi:MAG: VOC family protein [Planctomycetes bacterium]|nr:VOC family protein [Planctomycetota bacterium]
MSEQPKPAYGVGSFCWNELYTNDLKKAGDFYKKVLGWNFVPHGEMGGYNMILLGDKAVGGAMDISKPEFGGMPSCWGYYIDVEDCDKSVERAKSLGAEVMNGPSDVPEVGRFAALKDPTGAFINLITLKQHATEVPCAEPGHFLWVELMSRDFAKSRAFYTELIGWKPEEMPMPGGTYTLFRSKNGNAGGGMTMPPDVPKEVPDNWTGYIHVTDIEKSCKDVEAAGGHVIFPPMEVPNVGRFSQISDPTNAVVAIMQPAQMG